MSYARGIMYVYNDVDKGYTCYCPNQKVGFGPWLCNTPIEMAYHMMWHVHRAIRNLYPEYEGIGPWQYQTASHNYDIGVASYKAATRLFEETLTGTGYTR